MKYATQLILLFVWVYGIILAKGVISTLVAIFFAPWAWYLVVEKIVIMNGWL